MPGMAIRSTRVTPAAGGGLRVEIEIRDNADIATAQEAVSLATTVQAAENPSLLELQLAALSRMRDVIEERMHALRPKTSAH